MSVEISERLKEYIEKNTPENKKMSLRDFLSEEKIEEFGIKAEITKEEGAFKITYHAMAEPKIYKEGILKTCVKEQIIKITETIAVNYSVLSSYIAFDESLKKYFVIYVPSLRFPRGIFFLFNEVIGFKQQNFKDCYSVILDPLDSIIKFPKILNKADFAGKSEYMFISEAREFLPAYFFNVGDIVYGNNNGNKPLKKQNAENFETKNRERVNCALGLTNISIFFDCANCEACCLFENHLE